jgi:hypothetical protein
MGCTARSPASSRSAAGQGLATVLRGARIVCCISSRVGGWFHCGLLRSEASFRSRRDTSGRNRRFCCCGIDFRLRVDGARNATCGAHSDRRSKDSNNASRDQSTPIAPRYLQKGCVSPVAARSRTAGADHLDYGLNRRQNAPAGI